MNEAAIFGAVEQLREIAKAACKGSKSARRQCARQPVDPNSELAGKAPEQDNDIRKDLKHYKVEIW